MTEIDKFIDSGILNAYVLGQLSEREAAQVEEKAAAHPEIHRALTALQDGMNAYLSQYNKAIPGHLKEKLKQQFDSMTKLIQLNDDLRLDSFVAINESADYLLWNNITRLIEPPEDYDVYMHDLYQDEAQSLALLWIKSKVPEEVHETVHERVLVLEGRCTGRLGDERVELQEGDFWRIPLHVPHTLEVHPGESVKLLLMRQVA